MEHSRRDDLESLLFVLIDLHFGKLPWDMLSNNQEHETIELKKNMFKTNLCKNMPKEFMDF